MLLLTNADVEKVLDMKVCVEALELGYADLTKNDAIYRPRSGMVSPSAPFSQFSNAHYHFALMEGLSRSHGVCAVRIRSDIYASDAGRHIQFSVKPGTYCGLIMVFSIEHVEPLAIIQDGFLQHMRLGGTAGLGAKYLARNDSSVAAIIGSGGHARTYLWAFSTLFNLKKAKVYSPTNHNRNKYADEMSKKLNLEVEPVESIKEAMQQADIVATCTDAERHVIDNPELIEEGMFLTDNTPIEWGPRAIDRCEVRIRLGWGNLQTPLPETTRVGEEYLYVAGQPNEIQRLPRPTPAQPYGVEYWPLFVELLRGNTSGRTTTEDVTFFNNHGTQGLQFASVSGSVYRLAKEAGLGRKLPTEWFLEDIRD